MDRFLGKRLDGRYEIQEIIGIGGMAVVYKAYDVQENRIVAVKILKEEFGTSSEFLRRFQNESKVIAVLSHPNVVKVYDVSFGDNFQYIVMEYIDGITLKEYIERKQSIPWRDALYFTVQILHALQHAHDKGIIHRDVKPQNIMLLRDGTIKVTDFGIARFSRSEERTITDKAIGSVHYISPEQAKGGPIDEKADLYSVGVLMYEMLTGRLPFDGDNAVSVAIMQLQDEPTPPRDIDPSIPLGLCQITMRAMRKNPAHRYHSDAEMLRDLEEFKRNPSVDFGYEDNCVDSDEMQELSSGSYYSDVDIPEPNGAVADDMQGDNRRDYYDYDDRYDKQYDKQANRKSPVLPVLAGIAVAFVLVFAIAAAFIFPRVFGGNSGTFKCPYLVGVSLEEAKTNNPTLNIAVEEYIYSDEYDYGVIVSQDVLAGKAIKDGAQIKVKVSKGKTKIDVPDVYNMNYEDAKKSLENSDLQVKIEEINDDQIDIDRVIRTSPARGQTVDIGTEITVYVSLGKAMKYNNVVSVVGLFTADAKAQLEKLGFVVVVEKINAGSEVQVGAIASQSVPKGTSYGVGQTITIYENTGKTPVEYEFTVSVTKPSGFSTDTYSFKVVCGNTVKMAKATKDKETYNFSFSTTKSLEEIYVYVVVDGKRAVYQTFLVREGVVGDALSYDNWDANDNWVADS